MKKTPVLSPQEALFVLAVLLERRQVRPSHVLKARASLDEQIAQYKARVDALERVKAGAKRNRKAKAEKAAPKAKKARAPRKLRRVSAKTRALRKQQGQWMGTLRPLNQKQKAQLKAIKEKSGFKAAMAAAKRLGQPTKRTAAHPRKAAKPPETKSEAAA